MTGKGNQDKGLCLLASSCPLTSAIPTSLSWHPAPTAQEFLFYLGLCVRWSPSPRPSSSSLHLIVMKSLTEATLECSDPERDRYTERSHEGEKAHPGSQSPGTVPDSWGEARAAETEAAGHHTHSQEASAIQACCCSALLHVHSAGSKVGNVATQSGQLLSPQLMKSRLFPKACPEASSQVIPDLSTWLSVFTGTLPTCQVANILVY